MKAETDTDIECMSKSIHPSSSSSSSSRSIRSISISPSSSVSVSGPDVSDGDLPQALEVENFKHSLLVKGALKVQPSVQSEVRGCVVEHC